jgi:hypothetical protein
MSNPLSMFPQFGLGGSMVPSLAQRSGVYQPPRPPMDPDKNVNNFLQEGAYKHDMNAQAGGSPTMTRLGERGAGPVAGAQFKPQQPSPWTQGGVHEAQPQNGGLNAVEMARQQQDTRRQDGANMGTGNSALAGYMMGR